MNRKTIGNILSILLWICQGVAQTAAGIAIWRLNMLPNRYFALLVCALAAVWLIVGAVLFLRRKAKETEAQNKKQSVTMTLRRVLGWTLSIVIIVCCCVVCKVVSEVRTAVDTITGAAQSVQVSMSVYVLADDPASSIADTAGYTFAYLDAYETDRTQQAVSAIGQENGGQPQTAAYTGLTALVEALYSGECDAIILNSAYVTLLEDTEEFGDFSLRARVLYTVMTEQLIEPTEPVSTEPSSDAETEPVLREGITATPFIVYISGSDTTNYYLTTSRSDVNILMVVNPTTKQVLLINTPRDYYVSNPAGYGAKDKLTHCGIFGIPCSMGALEDLYDTQIQYFAQINFTGVEKLVDSLGGVDVYSDVSFYALREHWISKGMNHLNGEQALAFARDRKSLADGDNARGRHQMAVINAVIQKVTSGTTIISNYTGILESIQGMFKTNMTYDEIGALAKMQLEDMAQWNVLSYAVTGYGGSDTTYSMPGLYCYVMYPDRDTVDWASELIDRVLAGEILTEDDLNVPD